MFTDNQRISTLQLERQLALTYLGPLFLWIVPGFSIREGVFAVLLASLFLILWLFFLLRQKDVYQNPERYWGKGTRWMIHGIYQIYLVLTGGWLVGKTGELLTTYLVTGFSKELICGVLILAALGSGQNIQARGRLAQTVWYVIAGLIAVFFFLAVFQKGQGKFLSSSYEWSVKSIYQIITEAGRFFCGFLGIILIPFISVKLDDKKKDFHLFRMIGRAGIWAGICILVLGIFFGERGKEALEYPILDLMAGVRIPGGFLQRIDLLFLVVLLFCLLFSISSVFFYSALVSKKMGNVIGRIPMAIGSFFVAVWDFSNWSVMEWYPKALYRIFLPVFIVLTICNSLVRRKGYEK